MPFHLFCFLFLRQGHSSTCRCLAPDPLPQPPEFWGYRPVLLHPTFFFNLIVNYKVFIFFLNQDCFEAKLVECFLSVNEALFDPTEPGYGGTWL